VNRNNVVPFRKPCGKNERKEPRIRFEPCDCGSHIGAHGYFYDSEGRRSPLPNASMETAEETLYSLAEERNLMSDEVDAVRAQIQAAGLQETMGDEERTMLFAVAVGNLLTDIFGE